MTRYDLTANLVGYKKEDKKIYIQIDAVPYTMLLKAIENGYVPTIAKLLKKSGYKLYKVFSELPSNTPAAQMKIMYGVKGKIKAFRWYSKKNKKHYSFKTPITADYWEKMANSETKEPLLEDGAGYINLYSGGAKRTILTLSKALDKNMKHRLSSNEVWQFFFLNADFILVVCYKLVKEFFIELYEYLKYKIKKIPQRDEKFFPYVRMATCVFFREISTMGAILEINENTSKIFITYTAYDEVGHQRGPETKETLKTLKDIDKTIKKLLKKSKAKGYKFYIFSDHGQTSSVPFEKRYGISLKELITKYLDKEIEIGVYGARQETNEFMTLYFLKVLFKGIILIGSKFFDFFARIVKYIFIKGKTKLDTENLGKKDDIIVTNSGPLSHIYFTQYKNRLDDWEIAECYGDLFNNLAIHDGFEFGVVKNGDRYRLYGRNGEIVLNKKFEIEIERGELLKNYGLDKDLIISSLEEVIAGEECGDIILFGSMIEDNKIINFENQYGAHGGIGGMQNEAFLITKDEDDFKNLKICNLYDIFIG